MRGKSEGVQRGSASPIGVADRPPAPDPAFDRLVADLADVFGAERADLRVLGADEVWLVAAVNDDGVVWPWQDQLCAVVAQRREPLVLPDLAADAVFAAHPAARRVGFYVGTPLTSRDGAVIGVLCAWDADPRQADAEQLRTMDRLAAHAMSLLELSRVERAHQHDLAVLSTTGEVLEMIVGGAELADVLQTISLSVQAVSTPGLCSIMLLDGDALVEGSAPSLPAAFRALIEGEPIGPAAGSCGSAAYLRSPVIATDIATDDRWRDYAGLALGHGLRACWSLPVIAVDDSVVGVLALYFNEVREPLPDDLVQLARWVNLAEVAISRARSLAALRDAASRDPLTGLSNRPQLMRELERRLRGADAADVAIAFVDLDRFKAINDTHGHHVGDHFLKLVAARLSRCAGTGDLVGRLGGDEFVIVTSSSDADEVERLAHHVLRQLTAPMSAFGQTVQVSASVGLATAKPLPGRDLSVVTAADLVSEADLAMYESKSQGRAGVTWFTPPMRERAQDRLQLPADLEAAIVNGELWVAYQPQVEVRSGAVAGVEALLRWTSPTRGAVPPAVFIPLAEECGLIARLGELVLRAACGQLGSWRADDVTWAARDVWVNVSVHQLADPGFPALVGRVLEDTGLPPSALGLEITESSVMCDEPLTGRVLAELRGLGVRIAIDDFGTGFSSMSRLKHVPVDVLKIDRAFVMDLATDVIDAQIVGGLLALAGSLGLEVVAEGVETTEQRERLLELGCGWAQGFLWSRPVPAADLAQLVITSSSQALNSKNSPPQV